MTFVPPERAPYQPLRSLLPESDWRRTVELVAQRHGLWPCELTPYEKGETVVWRAGEHVVKLTVPECQYQIDAEVGALTAVSGALGVATPELVASGMLSGWPYVVMTRIGGQPLAHYWSDLARGERLRLAGDLGALCRRLHELPPQGFRADWHEFSRENHARLRERHGLARPPALASGVLGFLDEVGPLGARPLVPLHTELLDQHVYVTEQAGRLELSGLLDFADARLGPAEYDFTAPVEFLFRKEPGLLREFLLRYGKTEAELDERYSDILLAFALSHRFANLDRLLGTLGPRPPASLRELAAILFPLTNGRAASGD